MYRFFASVTGIPPGATRIGEDTHAKKRYRMNAARWREQAYIERKGNKFDHYEGHIFFYWMHVPPCIRGYASTGIHGKGAYHNP